MRDGTTRFLAFLPSASAGIHESFFVPFWSFLFVPFWSFPSGREGSARVLSIPLTTTTLAHPRRKPLLSRLSPDTFLPQLLPQHVRNLGCARVHLTSPVFLRFSCDLLLNLGQNHDTAHNLRVHTTCACCTCELCICPLSAHAHTSYHTLEPVTYTPCASLPVSTAPYTSSCAPHTAWMGREILIYIFFLSAAATAFCHSANAPLVYAALSVFATTLVYDVYHLPPATYHLPLLFFWGGVALSLSGDFTACCVL